MIKNVIRGFAFTMLFASSSMTYAAQPSIETEVEYINCYCAFWGGNEDCLTTNGGNLCAGNVDRSVKGACRVYDDNC